MSKYNALWEYMQENDKDSYTLTFDQIQKIAQTPIDHSFLKYKKELLEYGYQVKKISIKTNRTHRRQKTRPSYFG